MTVQCIVSIALTESLEEAIEASVTGNVYSPHDVHERVRKLYTWQDVARRTERVYDSVYRDTEIHLQGRIKK